MAAWHLWSHMGRSWWTRCSEQGLPAHLREVRIGQLPWAGSCSGSPGARTGLHVLSDSNPRPSLLALPWTEAVAGGGQEGCLVAAVG